jgi:CPA2 family monovalent cation:H+ antiporter-2
MDLGLLFIRDLAVVLLVAAAVGAIFRWLKLSVVVGYLVAGMIVGPYTPIRFVSDIGRLHTLSELGLVFLMFFIGMELSLGRLRRLGMPLVATVGVTAWLVFHASRILGESLGWTPTAGLFLAAMLMVSSSAIISKTLSEAGYSHEKFGRRALGMSLMEDVVAVVMLTLLTARVADTDVPVGIVRTLGMLGGFIALLVALGLLIVPNLLRRLAKSSDSDLKVATVAGVLLWVAFLAARAGYSVALGAFLLGMIVGETAYRDRIARSFVGVQGMFVTVFFVSIGMLIDVKLVAAHWLLILGVALFSIAVRACGSAFALLLTGATVASAIQTAVVVTPIGEFSYIIAQLGVLHKVVPDYFYGLAVGISVVTAFTAPLLLRASEPLAEWIDARQPSIFRRSLAVYHEWLETLSHQLKGSGFWILTRSRIGQVTVEILLLLGVLGFSPMLRDALVGIPPAAGIGGREVRAAMPVIEIAYWSAVFVAALAMAVAIWRNVTAMGLIVAEAALPRSPAGRALRPVLDGAVQAGAAVALAMVFWALFPLEVSGWWSFVVVIDAIALFLFLFWRRLIRWHSQFQSSVSTALGAEAARQTVTTSRSVQDEDWGIDLVEVGVPDDAAYAGRTIRDLELRQRFGATIVAVERHGFGLPNPGPDVALFPGDKVLLIGDDAAAARTRAYLEQSGKSAPAAPRFSESGLETVVVPPQSPRAGRSLAELQIFSATGVQVLGLRRNGGAVINPTAGEALQPGDRLLILATPEELRLFRNWLRE